MHPNTAIPVPGDEPVYTRSIFEAIIADSDAGSPYRNVFVCTDDGARVADLHCDGDLAWHPACEIMAPGSPNPLDTPWLPFPFSARQLAALLVDGWGYFIQQKFGEWQDGPNQDTLDTLGALGGKAKEALIAAYEAYRSAITLAPRLDRNLETYAGEINDEYNEAREEAIGQVRLREKGISKATYLDRLARVNDAVSTLGKQRSETRKIADEAYSRWRSAVVQHLLLPVEQVPEGAFESSNIRALTPSLRAHAIRQQREREDSRDSAAGKAHWDLMIEIGDVGREIRYWQLFNAQNITEAGRRKDELKELNTRLADLNARMNHIDPSGGGKRPQIDVAQESLPQRQKRRLADLRAFGGEWVKRGGKWRARDHQSGAFKRLVEQERGNGSLSCSEKSVRLDLCAAADAAAEERRSGVMLQGLAAP